MLVFYFFNKDTTSQNSYIKGYAIISRKDQRKQYSKIFKKEVIRMEWVGQGSRDGRIAEDETGREWSTNLEMFWREDGIWSNIWIGRGLER